VLKVCQRILQRALAWLWNGYGRNVKYIFHELRDPTLKDVWAPAKKQFDGASSHGNGGAMRISPVGTFVRLR